MSSRFSWNYLIGLITFGGITISPINQLEALEFENLNKNIGLGQIVNNDLKGLDTHNLPRLEEVNKEINQNSNLELIIISDKQYDINEKIFVAEGNVQVNLKHAKLKANRIEFDRLNNNITASGGVVFTKGSQYFQASLLVYNITNKEGFIEDLYGVIDLKYIVNDLNLILKNSENSYYHQKSPQGPIQNISLKGGFNLRGGSIDSTLNPIINNAAEPITRWRMQSPLVRIRPDGWESKQVNFTNDPFNPAQLRIEAKDVLAIEDESNSMIISCKKSRLILDEKLSIPLGERRFGKNEPVRWNIGIDFKDRDGLFFERQFNPIQITEGVDIFFKPQFLLQRGIIGQTNSYIESGASPISSNKRSNASFSDLIGLNTRLKGNKLGFDIDFTADITSFNPNRFYDASRYWGNLSRDIKFYNLGDIKTSIFAAYRYKAWNGSLGETDIYSAYGSFLEKKIKWEYDNSEHEANLSLGFGKYQAEAFQNKSLLSLWKASVFSSLRSKYKIWNAKSPLLPENVLHRYSPIKIVPSLNFKTELSTSYFVYENSNSQALFNIALGPEIIFGNFHRAFLDYTRISIMPGITIKDGSSPFEFDNNIDLKTLKMELDQQLYGPIVLSSGFKFNIDSDSSNYGKSLESKIAILYQRRAYDIGLFYQPYQKAGGIMINLNGFDYNGAGKPFYK